MKGAELPINTLIIIVIGVVVLIAIIIFFSGVVNTVKPGVNLETSKSNACQMLTSIGCNQLTQNIAINDFDADKDGKTGTAETGSSTNWNWADNMPACPLVSDPGDNLAALCHCWYGINGVNGEKDCKTNVCNCPTTP